MKLNEFFESRIPAVEAEMRAVVDLSCRSRLPQPTQFNRMLRYHLGFANADGSPSRLPSGKRIRPMLVLMCAQACGGKPEHAVPAAAAVELLHNFSLIHDDIEDHDELRRGRATLWKLEGIEQAINAGDAMFAQAHIALLRLAEHGVLAERVLRALRCFDEMCVHLTLGQHLDMQFEKRHDVTAENYLEMIAGKTGALVMACCEIGGYVAGANAAQLAALRAYGRAAGRAFQLQDDVLGIWGDTSKTGKTQGDLVRRKKSLPVLVACDLDPQFRAAYFSSESIDVNMTAARIEALGGRQHTESRIVSETATALTAINTSELTAQGRELLHELAQSLIGRSA